MRTVGKPWGDFAESWGIQLLNGYRNLFVEIVDTPAGDCRQPAETAETIRSVNHLGASRASLRAEQNGPEKRERERNSFKNCGKSVGRKGMALKIVKRHGNILQMRGTVQLPNGQKKRIERTTRTEDIEIALIRMRDYERELFGLMPSVDTLRMALEMIVLLAESGRAHELPRILSVAEKALSLLPKAP